MTRNEAARLLREELNKHNLTDWSVRLNQNADSRYLGLCSHKDKCIILSAHHIDIHPDPDVINTIRHEVAHALTPGHSHDDIWESKAREIGCDNTLPCSSLSLSPEVIDAIRSGADVEVTFDEHVIRVPKYNITRLQDKCPYCGKVAKTESEKTITYKDEDRPDLKFIRLECGHSLVKQIPKGTPFEKFQMGGDESCEHSWDKNKCLTCGRFRLYEFQIDGARFIEAALSVNHGAGCFDEMGLGKTNQAMAAIFFHQEWWPVLWQVKSGLKYQFATTIIKWMGKKHVPQIVESSKDWLIPGLNHYIVGYDMLVQKTRTLKSGKIIQQGFDIEQFNRIGIKCVVLDECQQIKNADSSRTQMVRRVVKGRKVIALSGTPWKNRGSELYPVLNMMDYMKFPTFERFKRQWVDTYWQGSFLKEGGIRNIPAFREYTKDLCIRRERNEVMKELPTVNRTKLYIKMDPQQAETYDAAVEEFVKWYEESAAEITGMHLLAAMAKMRHLVALAKIPSTVEFVEEFIEDTDRKIVIFAHHKDVQALLFDDLKAKFDTESSEERIPVYKLTSEMSGQDRFAIQELFNKSLRAILVASTLAAGEGLNLQTCADCVIHERQWNPANEEQVEGRFIRIGQVATQVNATYAHMEGLTTIDPQLDGIVERKRFHYHKSMNKGEIPRWSEESIIKELAESIVNAHNAKKNRQVLTGAK